MDRYSVKMKSIKKKLKEQQDRELAKKLSSKELADLEWRKTEIKLEKKTCLKVTTTKENCRRIEERRIRIGRIKRSV